jgi:hypothetical protein
MSKLMLIAGILLVAMAIALGLMIFFSPGSVIGWGVTSEFAAILLIGGVVALGLGGVISALDSGAVVSASSASVQAPPGQTETVIPEFGKKVAATGMTSEEISPAVGETIRALEEARSDIRQAFGEGPRSPLTEPENEGSAERLPETDEPAAEAGDQLYVVEERTIRDRPARILSDGTVEAETDEGWMRFENLEHLDEYLDAMAPDNKA